MLLWAHNQLPVDEYLYFWRSGRRKIEQIQRDSSNFQRLFGELLAERLISEDDVSALQENFAATNRQTLNLIPGLGVKYRWPRAEAIQLDVARRFASVVKERIDEAMGTWSERLKFGLPASLGA